MTKPPRALYDKACDAEFRRKRHEYYLANRVEILAKQRVRYLRLIAIVDRWKQTGCACCGFNRHPDALEAHHLDPATKEGKLNQLVTGASPARIERELAKCVCLCANCHRLVHAGVIELPAVRAVA